MKKFKLFSAIFHLFLFFLYAVSFLSPISEHKDWHIFVLAFLAYITFPFGYIYSRLGAPKLYSLLGDIKDNDLFNLIHVLIVLLISYWQWIYFLPRINSVFQKLRKKG